MSNKITYGVIVLVSLFSGYTFYNDYHIRNENNRLKMKDDLMLMENSILKSEIATLSSRRTYEDGVQDTLIKSKFGNYEDGYHAAVAQQSYEKEVMAEAEKYKKEREKETIPVGGKK